MLQVSHLSKIYKTKGGADVKALDDVTVSFPEKGMVFLLGKSGSGKSTLLNVCGGLDSPTSGEIIVKGRSSKNFSQSDFDSYRNTFIGFIFQEYNILNEFSVEDNIALALELQGKPKDKKAIAELLEQVDLTGYAKRKPNTLSGGQKQRIAIARALVKSPEIIMADEPTGALDSATGKQVFDTLKKLSKDKLVLVVSHDRDFAEQYGDRVIELKDGKIISDVSKTQEEQVSLSANVKAVGDTLCVKKGAELSEQDFAEIKEFLKKSQSDIVIATGEKDVQTFKEVARITDDGEKEVFKDTDESKFTKKEYTPEDSKFIRSKLPMRHALKIGVSGLKTKPFRLFFTILLCTVAFVLFGLLSTMTFYESEATFRQTLTDSPYTMMRLEKFYQTREKSYVNGELDYEYSSSNTGHFSGKEIEQYAQTYGADTFGAISTWGMSFTTQTNSKYWSNEFAYFASLPQNNTLRGKITQGNYPQNDDEICVSSFIAESIFNLKIYDSTSGSPVDMTSVNDVLNKTISVNGTKYKIVGIMQTDELSAKYEPLKDSTSSDNWSLENSLYQELRDGVALVGFVTENHLTELSNRYSNSYGTDIFQNHYLYVLGRDFTTGEFEWENLDTSNIWQNGAYANFATAPSNVSFTWFEDNKTTLANGETLLPMNRWASFLGEKLYKEKDTAWQTYHDEKNKGEYSSQRWTIHTQLETALVDIYPDNTYDQVYQLIEAWEKGERYPASENPDVYTIFGEWQGYFAPIKPYADAYYKLERLTSLCNWVQEGGFWDYSNPEQSVFRELTSEEKAQYIAELLAYTQEKNYVFDFEAKLYNTDAQEAFGTPKRFTVVGFYEGIDTWETNVFLSQDDYTTYWNTQKGMLNYYWERETNYVAEDGAIYSTLFLPYDHSDANTQTFIDIYQNDEFDENDVRIELACSLVDGFQMADSMIQELSKVFLYVGLVMALFAALLLSNFISVSISHKKKEIGILRAVGARSFDVFKIFFSESFVIAAICVVLSTVGSIVVCNVLNAEIASSIGASLFVFGVLSIAVLVGVALVTAVLATFLPVYNAAKKKPVDSIRAL